MIVYPAIDIRGGQCVRLIEGDYSRETVFDADPVDSARRWVDAGAEWLHVVDLDGAKAGAPANLDAIARIRAAISIPMQLGGGIRTADNLDRVLAVGIDRAILGTAAIRAPQFVRDALKQHGNRIAIGLDARDGFVAAEGWLDQTDVRADDLAVELRDAGCETVIFTDIRRDGTLAGPNLEALRHMVERFGPGVIASGGVGQPGDIDDVRVSGSTGVIIGRALYDGRVGLADAMRRASILEKMA